MIAACQAGQRGLASREHGEKQLVRGNAPSLRPRRWHHVFLAAGGRRCAASTTASSLPNRLPVLPEHWAPAGLPRRALERAWN